MTTEVHTLSGAYAIDALSDAEATKFRAHLEACPVCCEEVGELRDAAARLGASAALRPPESLKARVLSAVDRMPQQPPKVTSLESVRRRRAWLPKVVGAAAAVLVAVGAGVGISQMGEDEAPLAAPVSKIFAADDARTAEVQTDRGLIRVATSPGRNQMAVDARDLEPLDDNLVYKVWSIAGDEPTLVTVFEDGALDASMAMPAPGTQVAITVEPAGGPDRPTTEPIVEVDPSTV